MQALTAISTGRWTRWAIIVLMLLAAGVAGTVQPKLQELSSEAPQETWLPSGSEAREALDLSQRVWDEQDNVPAIVVFVTESGEPMSAAQLASVSARVEAIAEHARSDDDFELARNVLAPVDGAGPGGEISSDRSTLTVLVPVASSSPPVMTAVVEELREQVDGLPDGLRAHVTGPAGLSVDANKAFETLDVTLVLATATLVLVLLLLIYRSPLIALVPLVTVIVAYLIAAGITYALTQWIGLEVNPQTTGILVVLMFGAGTDYCLLIVARFREELHSHADTRAAMRETVRHTSPAILCSGATVALAMLVLLLAESDPTRNMGPVLALGIGLMVVAGLTFLPALLTVLGRRAFWPMIPREGARPRSESGFWSRLSAVVARRPLPAAVLPVLLLCVLALGSTQAQLPLLGWGSVDAFRSEPDSAKGFEAMKRAFDVGELAPNSVLVHDRQGGQAGAAAEQVVATLEQRSDVSRAALARPSSDGSTWDVTLVMRDDPFAERTADRVPQLRQALAPIEREHDVSVLVGGPTAQAYDANRASERDERLIIPIALAVIFLLLVLLVRALVAPLHLIASVVLSFLATVGLSLWLFDHVLGEPGAFGGWALYIFLFVVALGVDYNIFLVSRIREETARLGSTRAGVTAGLAKTGGIITSAGIILAGTFAVLAVLPVTFLFQIGFAVALGVLIDTFIVRSLIVPGTMHLLGHRNWWPVGEPSLPPGGGDAGVQQPAAEQREPAGVS